eukprot:CAMPEP_0195512334 /NCGR_PEP_ID=MMETSP0794_2-20130614/4328_1 /TAXON_ID=515487 /ORGANISM="Stephanopyxis turris, Strain CCMP 815" /LENGTH=323 /DNA_ID=CAMNT_0040640093 /DNA_START=100 /DNA_END=1071 /DNA_ORIENTATION=+
MPGFASASFLRNGLDQMVRKIQETSGNSTVGNETETIGNITIENVMEAIGNTTIGNKTDEYATSEVQGCPTESGDIVCVEEKYDNLDWESLQCDSLYAAAEVLGFDQEMWDFGLWSSVFSREWGNLTSAEKSAMNLFCWGENQNELILARNQIICPDVDPVCAVGQYENFRWEDLSCPNLYQAAETLGYNKTIWDDGIWTPVFDKDFDDLDQDEKDAMALLCYSQSNSISGRTNIICPDDDPVCEEGQYDTYYWEELECYSLYAAAEVLGFNQAMWDDGYWPETFNEGAVLNAEQENAMDLFCWSEENSISGRTNSTLFKVTT